jgi:hypothetical protein
MGKFKGLSLIKNSILKIKVTLITKVSQLSKNTSECKRTQQRHPWSATTNAQYFRLIVTFCTQTSGLLRSKIYLSLKHFNICLEGSNSQPT